MVLTVEEIEKRIDENKQIPADELLELLHTMEDEYHTVQELYDFRLVYNALLFNTWFEDGTVEVYKSRRHNTGEYCFDGEWFVVVAILPTGKQVTNHYHLDYWDYFKIPAYDKVKDPFDGHNSTDVLERLKEII